MANFIGKIGGRKFLVASFALVGVVVSALTGFDISAYTEVVIGIVAPYLLAQGAADAMSKGATSSSAQAKAE